MKEAERTMHQAIRDGADILHRRGLSLEDARRKYFEYHASYVETINHKTRRGSTDLYNMREACALYIKEALGVEVTE
jgi:hypothetical protein